MRARRSGTVPPSPNRRSNTTRGLISIGMRRGGSAPGNGVHVGAAVTDVASADQTGHVFGGEFERRKARTLADFGGRHLIDSSARANILAFGLLGVRAVQPGGRGARMVRAAVAQRVGHVMAQIAQHDDVFAMRWRARSGPG